MVSPESRPRLFGPTRTLLHVLQGCRLHLLSIKTMGPETKAGREKRQFVTRKGEPFWKIWTLSQQEKTFKSYKEVSRFFQKKKILPKLLPRKPPQKKTNPTNQPNLFFEGRKESSSTTFKASRGSHPSPISEAIPKTKGLNLRTPGMTGERWMMDDKTWE